MVSQEELATKMGWYVQLLSPVENDRVELTQEQYQKLLDAIVEIVAEREK
jgi:ribosome-binding protein aMBF1 (putative translation factor)